MFCSVHSNHAKRRRHGFHSDSRRARPGADRGRRRRGPDRVDAAGAPGRGAPAGQRAAEYFRSAEGSCAEPAGDGGAGGRRRGRGDRGAWHADGADGRDGVLRGVRWSRSGLRPSSGAPRMLGRRWRGRVLARREPVPATQPPADSTGASAQGESGGAVSGPDPLQPRADRPRAGRRGGTSIDPGERVRPRVRGEERLPARRRRGPEGRRVDRGGLRGTRGGDADGDSARLSGLLAVGE